jgi:hypothetical protein
MKSQTGSQKILAIITIVFVVAILILFINCISNRGEAGPQNAEETGLINCSADKYTFTKSDAATIGEKWHPELIVDIKAGYPEIKSLMNEYFENTDINWKIYYGYIRHNQSTSMSSNQSVMINYCGNDPDVKEKIVESLNQINEDNPSIFAIKVNSKNKFCDPFYNTANNSEKYWYPVIGFKTDTPDENISRLLTEELGRNVSWKQYKKEYYTNYYINLSQSSGIIPEDLTHFIELSIYGEIFYEIMSFNESSEYYPVTLRAPSGEIDDRIINSLKNEGTIIYPAKVVHIGEYVYNDTTFKNSYQQYENLYKSEEVAFIVKSFINYNPN